MKNISLRLDEMMLRRLEALANGRNATKSQLMREALEVFIRQEEKVSNSPILDRISDLVGSIEGPSDLSYNKQHLNDLVSE